MERQLARYSYLLGLVCMLVSVVWRITMVFSSQIHAQVGEVWYSSFWKAGAVFLLISIASVQHMMLQQKDAEKPAGETMVRAA